MATSDVRSVETTASSLTIVFGDGAEAQFNRFWLRDNCPSNGDRASLFREFVAAEIPDDLAIVDAAVEAGGVRVEFGDGASELFDPAFLREHARDDADAASATTWRTGHDPDAFTFTACREGVDARHALLEAVAHDGFALVTGVPDDGTEVVASWLGPIRETDFGRVFDIVTEPDPFTPSQSESALDPHTDDPYRYSPAGISILHCVAPCDGDGGASVIVDGFAIAEQIRIDDPGAFDMLTTLPVPYVHRRHEAVDQGDDVHLRAEAPIVALDGSGRVAGIRFHERSMAPMRLDHDTAEAFYPALMRFSRDVRSGLFAYERRLAPGEAFVYDNQRVLHGRTAIDGSRSRRHLRLCTIDRDQVHSRLRRHREEAGAGTERDPLPAGNLS